MNISISFDLCFSREYGVSRSLRRRGLRNPQSRAGFTLLELLVVIAIVSILLALLLPAVQSARSAARRIDCQTGIGQVALAAQNYVSQHGTFPGGDFYGGRNQHARLLPHLEQAADAERIFAGQVGYASPDPPRCDIDGSVYLCPVDPLAHPKRGLFNYVFSQGFVGNFFQTPTMTVPNDDREGCPPASILDGTSQTVLLSERLMMPSYEVFGESASLAADDALLGKEDWRLMWHTGADDHSRTAEGLAAACLGERTEAVRKAVRPGNFWDLAAQYNHVVPPNHPGCWDGSVEDAEFAVSNQERAAVPANSRHSGGVNAGMCDGSARFVSQGVDDELWRAAATIAGGEPQSAF